MAKILVVDDEENLALLLETILKAKGYEVETAYNGKEAVEKAKNTPFDLCLLDIRLPDINGVEVFLKLKEISPTMSVMMMTAYAVENLIEVALKEGAYTCIHKPFDIECLLMLIKEALESKKRIILIADSSKETREQIKDFLLEKHYTLFEAGTGADVIENVKKVKFDVMLLDYKLPDLNGIEVFKKSREIDPSIVVIILLDKTIEHLCEDALKYGFYGWLPKPIDKDSLIRHIEKILGKKKRGVN
ncbi:MAG: hypothetical protein CVU77_05140 [Elusimicrobia bacterium HGW-Elusimicrobia-1]|jgi:DNA-binding response OmpR family regulator|nr:MAG: hypothetical protein CVU77_05140 [Elusimicrobia bacterium HGW-Elusimicrobia-1]